MESITLKVIQGERLEDADRWSDSDPYVLVEVLDDNKAVIQEDQSKTVANDNSPQFDYEFAASADALEKGKSLRITVWDKDNRSKDDFLGELLLELTNTSGWHHLDRRGKLEVDLVVVEKAAPEPEEPKPEEKPEAKPEEKPEEKPEAKPEEKPEEPATTTPIASSLIINVIQGRRLQDADVWSDSDPYVLLDLFGEGGTSGENLLQLKSSTVTNDNNPQFNFRQEINDPAILAAVKSLRITLWDKDNSSADDFLGAYELELKPSTGKLAEGWQPLNRNGELELEVSYTYADVPGGGDGGDGGDGGQKPATPAKPEQPQYRVVTRREIRSMSAEDQQRFVDAVKKLMKNKDGPETSEWFRIAGYHGWPASYCKHGTEVFPHWHRAYLCHLEQALQKADVELGRDGDISLPYWNWLQEESGGQKFPDAISSNFNGKFPDDFFKADDSNELYVRGIKRYSESGIMRNLRRAQLSDQSYDAIAERQHWKAASTGGSGESVEAPHNSVHVCVGYPMNGVPHAAFDPIFFLHHCNVDRLYEKYIVEHTDSAREFEKNQQRMFDLYRRPDLYDEPLLPFKDPRSGKDYFPKDCFNIENMGYKYDELMPDQPDRIRTEPTYAVFQKIDVNKMIGNSYNIGVFLVKKGESEAWVGPEDEETWEENPGFAGTGAIFGGKPNCENCATRVPYSMQVDVTNALVRLEAARTDVVVRCMCVEASGKVVKIEDTPLTQFPVELKGPYFTLGDQQLGAIAGEEVGNLSDAERAEIMAVQTKLTEYEYYKGAVDGWYGPALTEAVKAYQTDMGLAVDGVVGPIVRASLLKKRIDGSDENDVEPLFKAGDKVVYYLGVQPGYLDREAVEADVANALQQWATAVNFTVESGPRESASVVIEWADQTPDGTFVFDGKGGVLAHTVTNAEAKKGTIQLDFAERWVTQANKATAKPGQFHLLPVVLHEFGHVLGIKHLKDPAAVMSSFYDSDLVTLTSKDTDQVTVQDTKLSPEEEAKIVKIQAIARGKLVREAHKSESQDKVGKAGPPTAPPTASGVRPPSRGEQKLFGDVSAFSASLGSNTHAVADVIKNALVMSGISGSGASKHLADFCGYRNIPEDGQVDIAEFTKEYMRMSRFRTQRQLTLATRPLKQSFYKAEIVAKLAGFIGQVAADAEVEEQFQDFPVDIPMLEAWYARHL